MSKEKYALFLGCMIPLRLPHMEAAARRLLKSFEIGIVDMPNSGCCPEPSLQSLDRETWTTLAARNLCIGEELGLNILTLCNGCFETLKTVNTVLKTDENLKRRVNEKLSHVKKQFKGTVDVSHLVEVLHNDIGPQRIRESVVKPLTGLKVASHHGCHLLRPSNVMKIDDPLKPTILDELVELTGASSVPYYKSMFCCGATMGTTDEVTARNIVAYKLNNVRRAGADCMVVVCPNCMLQYDVVQPLIKSNDGERFNMPVFYYPELLSMAMGVDPEQLGLSLHTVKVNSVLSKIGRS